MTEEISNPESGVAKNLIESITVGNNSNNPGF
jgi:hypothetical protein